MVDQMRRALTDEILPRLDAIEAEINRLVKLMDDPVKWALLDLLKLLDLIHDGEWHEEFQRIASTLGIELQQVDGDGNGELPVGKD